MKTLFFFFILLGMLLRPKDRLLWLETGVPPLLLLYFVLYFLSGLISIPLGSTSSILPPSTLNTPFYVLVSLGKFVFRSLSTYRELRNRIIITQVHVPLWCTQIYPCFLLLLLDTGSSTFNLSMSWLHPIFSKIKTGWSYYSGKSCWSCKSSFGTLRNGILIRVYQYLISDKMWMELFLIFKSFPNTIRCLFDWWLFYFKLKEFSCVVLDL